MDLVKSEKVSYWKILGMIRTARLPPPPRDRHGNYCWRSCDVAALRKLLAEDRRPAQAAAR
jgi:hypothetical protein